MARPSTLQLSDGEVTFKGFPKERVDQMKALLSGTTFTPDVLPPGELMLANKTESEDGVSYDLVVLPEMKDNAFGLRKNDNGNYEIVTVKYDVITKAAQVSEVKECNKFKDVAVGDFKVLIAKHFL